MPRGIRISPLPIDDRGMAAGTMQRRIDQQYRAFCRDCDTYVTEWEAYDDAIGHFIDHRLNVHHLKSATESPSL